MISNDVSIRQKYIDIIKKALLHTLYEENFVIIRKSHAKTFKGLLKDYFINLLNKRGYGLIIYKKRNPEEYLEGKAWPTFALTMIGQKRLDNIQYCAEEIIKNKIPGDFIEAGVWRGGATIFMKAILDIYGENRKVFVADSFEGLPKPNVEQYPEDKGDEEYKWDYLKISLDEVKQNFERFGLLDERVIFLKGWFKDTLLTDKIKKLALVRLDGDMYESTWDSLNALYTKLEKGGFVIIDDYFVNDSCRNAVNDYFKKVKVNHEIKRIDWAGAYFRK